MWKAGLQTCRTDEKPACRKSNVSYVNTCTACEAAGKSTQYIGETSRKLYERTREHDKDCSSRDEKSHMYTHVAAEHQEDAAENEGQEENLFKVKIVNTHRSSFLRQLQEVVLISRSKANILNSRLEYDRCLISTIQMTSNAAREPPREKKYFNVELEQIQNISKKRVTESTEHDTATKEPKGKKIKRDKQSKDGHSTGAAEEEQKKLNGGRAP